MLVVHVGLLYVLGTHRTVVLGVPRKSFLPAPTLSWKTEKVLICLATAVRYIRIPAVTLFHWEVTQPTHCLLSLGVVPLTRVRR